jgi:DNA-directed RNA polymerase I, II, and III subunit RPABC2
MFPISINYNAIGGGKDKNSGGDDDEPIHLKPLRDELDEGDDDVEDDADDASSDAGSDGDAYDSGGDEDAAREIASEGDDESVASGGEDLDDKLALDESDKLNNDGTDDEAGDGGANDDSGDNDSDEDDESDDDDGDDVDKFKRFDQELRMNYLVETHPESTSHNDDEIHSLAHAVRDKTGMIVDPLHRTIPILTKYEKTRVLGVRTKQLNDGAAAYVNIAAGTENIIDGYIIAMRELEEKKIPFIIRRPLPNGGSEYWYLQDLEII